MGLTRWAVQYRDGLIHIRWLFPDASEREWSMAPGVARALTESLLEALADAAWETRQIHKVGDHLEMTVQLPQIPKEPPTLFDSRKADNG